MIVKLRNVDIGGLSDAADLQNYGRALESLVQQALPLGGFQEELRAVQNRTDILNKEIKDLEDQKETIKEGGTRSSEGTDANWLTFVRTTLTRVGVIGFFVYFIALLSNLYRYTSRLSAFYYARADALILASPEENHFALLVDKIAPDSLDYGKQPRNPLDQAVGLTKELLSASRAAR